MLEDYKTLKNATLHIYHTPGAKLVQLG